MPRFPRDVRLQRRLLSAWSVSWPGARESRWSHWLMGSALTILLFCFPTVSNPGSPLPHGLSAPSYPVYFIPSSAKKSIVEARTGYLWGVNAIWLRDGDNANNPSGKREVSVEGPIFGIQGETRLFSDDLAARVQGWINLPQISRTDFYLDRAATDTLTARLWESESRYVCADLAAVYHLGPFGTYPNRFGGTGMPYTAALVLGYRYTNLDITSARHITPAGIAEDHFHVHTPYLGVHYAHEDFMGTLVRLDVSASALTLSRVDSSRQFTGEVIQLDGQSVSGFWVESLLSWSFPLGSSGFCGLFAQYSYQELSGGATVDRVRGGVLYSTRFSLDSITHLAVFGISGTVAF